MSILQVITFPDDILRQKSLPVDAVDNDIKKLMQDMLETLYEDKGVGLAAVQVGVLKRVIVLDLQDDDDTVRQPGFYPLSIANPEIITKSQETIVAKEGCLSVPEQGVEVERAKSIKIKFLDCNNTPQELEAENWLARVLQHEMDHLDGKLLIDYLSLLKRDIATRKLIKLKKHE